MILVAVFLAVSTAICAAQGLAPTKPADNVDPTKAELAAMYNTAYHAFDASKFPEALRQLDAIDSRQHDLAASKNLRGVILMRQGNYDQAEVALTQAAKIDPKFWNARFNLAEIPFLKKDWPEARKRFEQLLSTGKSDLAKEASQLIQYKILLTYLMEGKSKMVDSIRAKLELSPDTPAVDYVKAVVALEQKNQTEAKDWINAAEKNYSPQLNKLFVESLYEIGWMEKPSGQRRPSLSPSTTNRNEAPAETKQKNDCVIVAAEAYKRLQAQGIWTEVVGFTWNAPDGRKSGHAVCIFQLSKTDNILVYDGQRGTSDLKVKSADLQVIEQAYNRLIAHSGYTVSGFQVLVQEPRKASPPEGVLSTQETTKPRTADSQPQLSKRAARTVTHSRMDSRPASARQHMFQTESLLLRSGFKAIKVRSAKLQRVVNELRQGKISYVNYNGQLYYVYPAATKDKVYIGTQEQFNAFVGIRGPKSANEPQTAGPPTSYPVTILPPNPVNPMPPTPPYLR